MAEQPGSEVVVALRDAAELVGLHVEADADPGVDFALINPAGGTVAIAVKRVSLAAVDGLARRIDEWDRRRPAGTIGVLVADRVTAEARRLLNAAGWGWLDLRGHLHIVGEGLFIDADVPAVHETPIRSDPFSGHVGLEVAVELLLRPDQPAAIRRLAKTLRHSPSSVSDVVARLRTAGLLDAADRAVIPDLFWALAARWQPSQVDTAAVPTPGDGAVNSALRLGFDDVATTTGWALGDTVAAALYGAPVGVRADHPPDFYVPDQVVLRRAGQLLGVAAEHASRKATIRLAPVPAVCERRVDDPNETWPLAQPLFVALDLAQDPGRGREILAGWTPQRWPRVW